MLTIYRLKDGHLRRLEYDGTPLPEEVVWLDLLHPTAEENSLVESRLGLSIPTRQGMTDIEDSARLSKHRDAAVLTAVLIDGTREGRPARVQVTFISTKAFLVSVRYADPPPFRALDSTCDRQGLSLASADDVLAALLTSIVGHAADVLEDIGTELRDVSGSLFTDGEVSRSPRHAENRLQVILRRLGRRNMAIAILRESLFSLARMIPFIRQNAGERLGGGALAQLKQLDRDVRSLNSHETQLSLEISYLHDATIGLINLDQTRIIKAFSIAAVLFLPPTLVGTIYGMNFELMPELEWALGYPSAATLMVGSAIVPYFWFRVRGWL